MSSVILIFILLIIFLTLLIFGYKVTMGSTTATPEYKIDVVDNKSILTRIEPSDCKGDVYTMKTSCSRNGVVLDGTENKCGPGKEEWVLDPDAPGFQAAIGTGSCPVDYRDCEVECDKSCLGATWIEGNCIRDGVILDGSETDKCGRGMRTYTLDETASDYVAAKGRGICMKTYSSACDVECPQNAVAPPACVYSSTWQKSANGCVVSKDDKARQVGYDEDGWQESFKLALEAENCTGEKRLSEWETCKGAPAPVDCVGTWGPNDGWGPCTGPCGTQPQQKRNYTVTREAKNGGKVCPYENGKEETKNCGTVVTCPSDCEGYYSDPPCPTQCGQPASSITKQWIITKNPYGTGKACPTPTTKSCPATAPCPSNCQGYYSSPICPTQCGQPASSITKQWNTIKYPIGSGSACPSPSTVSCPATGPCPSNCVGQWIKTGECKSTYVSGQRTLQKYNKEYKYVYQITKPKVGTGSACPNNNGDTKWVGRIVRWTDRNC
jgi:hypothetical protein